MENNRMQQSSHLWSTFSPRSTMTQDTDLEMPHPSTNSFAAYQKKHQGPSVWDWFLRTHRDKIIHFPFYSNHLISRIGVYIGLMANMLKARLRSPTLARCGPKTWCLRDSTARITRLLLLEYLPVVSPVTVSQKTSPSPSPHSLPVHSESFRPDSIMKNYEKPFFFFVFFLKGNYNNVWEDFFSAHKASCVVAFTDYFGFI